MKQLLTVSEVARDLLKVHPNHIYRLIGQRKIPHLKIPGVGIRFDLKELELWIEGEKREVRDWTKDER